MRWIVALLLLSIHSYASTFNSCIEKNRLAFEQNGEFIGIAIDKEQLLVPFGLLYPSDLPKEWRLVRSDPLTGLAVVKANHNKTPVNFRTSSRFFEHSRFVSVLPDTHFESGVKEHQVGLCGAKLEKPIRSSSIICAPCYAVMGVGVMGRFVESDYILHLIRSDDGWGDLGFRLYENSNKIEFVSKTTLPVEIGDEVISIGDLNSTNHIDLMKKILLTTPKTNLKVGFKRGGVVQYADMVVAKREGGGVLADTLLESLGWKFTHDLFVHSVEQNSFISNKNAKVGDKLIEINGKPVRNSHEVKVALRDAIEKISLLIERDEFQFFIVIDKE